MHISRPAIFDFQVNLDTREEEQLSRGGWTDRHTHIFVTTLLKSLATAIYRVMQDGQYFSHTFNYEGSF